MESRNAGKRVLGIGVAMVLSSAFAFVFLGAASRWLGPDHYATFMSAWGLVFGLAAAMLSAEQEVARQATLASLERRPAPGSVAQVGALAAAFALAALVIAWIFPAGRQALGNSWIVAVLTAVAVLGFAMQYLVRGVALGTRRTRDYIVIIIGDGGLRLLAILALLALSVSPTVEWALAAVVVGCFSWLLVVGVRHSISWRTELQPWRVSAATIGGLMVANALQAVLLTAYPTLVATLVGASPDLATFFGIVVLSRIPLVAVSPIQTLAVPEATRLIHSGRTSVLSSLLLKIALALVAAVVVVAAAAYYLGPWVMRVFLGPRYADAPGTQVAATLAAGCVMAVAMLQTSVLVALRRYALVTLSWAAGVAGAVVAILAWPGTKADAGALGFVVGSVTAYLVSGMSVLVSSRHPDAAERAVDRST